VIAQDPAPGSAERGSEVTITVSRGQPEVVVQSVIGESRNGARASLRAQGLKVEVQKQDVTSPNEDGVVIEQSPPGGTRVSPGDTVTLVVGKFKQPKSELPDEE
jgi:serine/threonine-protein kinase